MYTFPEGFYVDVRIEDTYDTRISYKKEELHEIKERHHKGAFIRLFDGNRWYYSSTTDIPSIQQQIDALAQMATPHENILYHPIVKAFESNQDALIQYEDSSISDIPTDEKKALLKDFLPLFQHPAIVNHVASYVDHKAFKTIYSSKGSKLSFDKQTCGILVRMELSHEENKDQAVISRGAIFFEELKKLKKYFETEVEKNIYFIQHAKEVSPGEYPVLLSPLAAGVFTHESFGHKSESDFMVGDETMKAEWALGKKIGPSLLTIIDNGLVPGNGYVPYDDEGSKGRKTEIISNGILTGRLHSTATAAQLQEPLTGNARAINFQFEPIVRMTTTYIEKGDRLLKDIISEMDQGVYVDTIKHGSGMSTFTIAPARAYWIEKGRIDHPIKISVITGNVFETLAEVDAVSQEFELLSFVGGGCGKMEQMPLPVGFGGPYTRVKKLKVQ